MADENSSDRRQTFTLHCRWFTIRIGGNVIFGLTFALLCVLAVGVWYHDQSVRNGLGEVKGGIEKLSVHQQETTSAQIELNYITTLSADERKKLNLEMPDTLRKRMRRRYDEEGSP